MNNDCQRISYEQTGYFSKQVIDYLHGDKWLKQFYAFTPNKDGIVSAIEERSKIKVDRTLLVEVLLNQMQQVGIEPTALQSQHLAQLKKENTFTITTAHQPNLFTGPLYVVYKIFHAIALAAELSKDLPNYNFVPVYYMGSEDADLDELGNWTIQGHARIWNTQQTGAVGRMLVDDLLLKEIASMKGQLAVLEHGQQLIDIFIDSYQKGRTIQDATLVLMHHLFSIYGLLVLIPDDARLKQTFVPVVLRELQEQFSSSALQPTIDTLSSRYKVQVTGRPINLFYLHEQVRERIEFNGTTYTAVDTGKTLSASEIAEELKNNPERFSPNVILRGLYQETILPNIVFIGGGAELSYWMELKQVFATAHVFYPMLVLRNSFLCMEEKDVQLQHAIGLSNEMLFTSAHQQELWWVENNTNRNWKVEEFDQEMQNLFSQLREKIGELDPTLAKHVAALAQQSANKMHQLSKKVLRSEKRSMSDSLQKLAALRARLFPGQSLQERKENASYFLAKYGLDWMKQIHSSSLGLEQEFTIVQL